MAGTAPATIELRPLRVRAQILLGTLWQIARAKGG